MIEKSLKTRFLTRTKLETDLWGFKKLTRNKILWKVWNSQLDSPGTDKTKEIGKKYQDRVKILLKKLF